MGRRILRHSLFKTAQASLSITPIAIPYSLVVNTKKLDSHSCERNVQDLHQCSALPSKCPPCCCNPQLLAGIGFVEIMRGLGFRAQGKPCDINKSRAFPRPIPTQCFANAPRPCKTTAESGQKALYETRTP